MVYGQIVENFETGDVNKWVQSPENRWIADTLGCISGSYSLHHYFDNPDAGNDRVGIKITDLHLSEGTTVWSFVVRHGYDPSSSNNWSAFLLSDSDPSAMDAEGSTNGFAIGVNLTGYDDTLRLWKVKGNTVTTIVNSRINWQTDIGTLNAVKIVVERSGDGIWSVTAYLHENEIFGTMSSTDTEILNPCWFGISYKYSSSRDRLFWFDDLIIDGVFYADEDPPVITDYKVSGRNSVEITLSEFPDDESVDPDNFALNNSDNKSISVKKINDLTYNVEFKGTHNNKLVNNLIISSLCDNYGNCNNNITLQFIPVWAETGDVVISEIMADPLPEVALPAKEYLEITNRTEFPFNLKNWRITSLEQSFLFPEVSIRPSEIMIICSSKDTSLFAGYGTVAGLKQFPSLTDGGKILCLCDSSGTLIHGVEYSSDWYKDELKSGGGWSLEMIDTRFPFTQRENWIGSASRKGGTPGLPNSVSHNNPDNFFYGIENAYPVDSMNVIVRFSEPVINFPEMTESIRINGEIPIALFNTDPLYREFNISTEEPLIKRKRYELSFASDLKDFAGNRISRGSYGFGLFESPEPGDILFNELLFNPLPGDPDYIELYNHSGKIIDASRLQIVTIHNDIGDTSQLSQVSSEKRCILPASYYAITADAERISERYFSADVEHLFKTASLPPMSDKEGHLALFNRELDRIDEVYYNEDMHFSLLSGFEGISLEKSSPGNKSEEKSNWHSASESAGWGTPGAPNSIFIEAPASADKIVFSSSKITPDGDGIEDLLSIGFSLTGDDNVVSAAVYDETGQYVRKIAANMYLGPEGSLIWDGTADDASPVNTGIYIVYITLYNTKGKTERWKKVCTVIRE